MSGVSGGFLLFVKVTEDVKKIFPGNLILTYSQNVQIKIILKHHFLLAHNYQLGFRNTSIHPLEHEL